MAMRLVKIKPDHYELDGEKVTDKLQEVKELIGEVDVNILAANLANPNVCKTTNWIEGYNQALEDNKEKKYTEEDIMKAFESGWSSKEPQYDGGWKTKMTFEGYIKSLQPKTSWEVEIVDGKLKLK